MISRSTVFVRASNWLRRTLPCERSAKCSMNCMKIEASKGLSMRGASLTDVDKGDNVDKGNGTSHSSSSTGDGSTSRPWARKFKAEAVQLSG